MKQNYFIFFNYILKMKNAWMVLVFICIATIVSFGQISMPDNKNAESQIIALEKAGWEAWKNNKADWFQSNTTEEFLSITSEGISDKEQVVNSTPTACDVKSVSIDDFKFVMLSENTVALTYIAIQDGVCGDKKLAEKIRVVVNYVNRNGKWLEALYMETPLDK